MNDNYFEQWAELLPQIRQTRVNGIQDRIRERGPDFKPKDLFDVFVVNFDKVLMQWWEFEKKSWSENPSEEIDLASENLRNELESVIEFEIDAMNNELVDIRQELTWSDADVKKGQTKLDRFAKDIQSNYILKIEKLVNKAEKKPKKAEKTSVPRTRTVSGGGGTSGASIFTMFMIGLILGLGAAFYFWDANKKNLAIHEKKIKEAEISKKEVIDSMTILSETYIQLAKGRIMNIPELERKIGPIKKLFDKKRRQVNQSYGIKERNLRKRVPAGDRLDRSLAKLEDAKKKEMIKLDVDEKIRLEPYTKQLEMHNELLNQNNRQ